MAASKRVANPSTLSEARIGTRVRLADQRTVLVTSEATEGVWGRREVGGRTGELEWFAGSLVVQEVLS